ncbi:MAG TPA: aldehyde dehydrogenase, partial [Rhodospirillales bacterium]|nr:aldehyde dehydrogenase [Rhodospirillales bacterium]
MNLSSRARTYDLRRREVAKRISEVGGKKLLVVTGLGSTNWDFTAAGDRDLIFPMWGAMGGAVSVGLGLALAQPKNRVLVATGDGEMLMGLGSLATVAVQAPANLTIAVFDNEHYGETGMQLSATADEADIAAIATGCGIKSAVNINNDKELK